MASKKRSDEALTRGLFEKQYHELTKVLSCDVHQVHSVLASGLGLDTVTIDAAIYLTATVECILKFVLENSIAQYKSSSDNDNTNTPQRLTPMNIQMALRSNKDLQSLLNSSESIKAMLFVFQSTSTTKMLLSSGLITQEEADLKLKEADENSDDDEDEESESKQDDDHHHNPSEWARRPDDPFSDNDFATILRVVHPVYSLSRDAMVLLSAFVREVLNVICESLEISEEDTTLKISTVQDAVNNVFVNTLLSRISDFTTLCIDTYYNTTTSTSTVSEEGTPNSIVLKFSFINASSTIVKQVAVKPVIKFTAIAAHIMKKLRITAEDSVVFIHKGKTLDHVQNNEVASNIFSTNNNSKNTNVVFILQSKWWDFKRREDARRGITTTSGVKKLSSAELAIHSSTSVRSKFVITADHLESKEKISVTAAAPSPLRITKKSPVKKINTTSPPKKSPAKKSPGKCNIDLKTRSSDTLKALDEAIKVFQSTYDQVSAFKNNIDSSSGDSNNNNNNSSQQQLYRDLRKSCDSIEVVSKNSKQLVGTLSRLVLRSNNAAAPAPPIRRKKSFIKN